MFETNAAQRRPPSTPATGAARRRRVPVGRAARDLLAEAGRSLGIGMRAQTPAARYAAAHLAALRAAAAVLAATAKPGRGRLGNAWSLLAVRAPDLAEWAGFFAAGAGKRQLAEAGISRAIGTREADDLLRQAAEFVDLVEHRLGGHQHAAAG